MEDNYSGDPVDIEINGILDLHHFSPKDLKYLLPDYLEECIKKEIHQVRIIHGKGTGTLRRCVHAILEKMDTIISYKTADETSGSWGATIVYLRNPPRKEVPRY